MFDREKIDEVEYADQYTLNPVDPNNCSESIRMLLIIVNAKSIYCQDDPKGRVVYSSPNQMNIFSQYNDRTRCVLSVLAGIFVIASPNIAIASPLHKRHCDPPKLI